MAVKVMIKRSVCFVCAHVGTLFSIAVTNMSAVSIHQD
jgi:hypothetical protein